MKTKKKSQPKATDTKQKVGCYWCSYLKRYYPDIPLSILHQEHQPKSVKKEEEIPVVFTPQTRDWSGKKMVSNPLNSLTASEEQIPVELLGTDDKSVGLWCELLRDEHEAKGEHLKVSGLIQYAMSLRQRAYAERCAVRGAITRIYEEERARERQRDAQWEERVCSRRATDEIDSGASSEAPETQSGRKRRGAQRDDSAPQKHANATEKRIARPGVIAKIIEVLRSASKKRPVTKEQILDVLVKEFPERERDSMRGTVSSQVPKGLYTEKKIVVKSNDEKVPGYWIPKPKLED